MRIRALPVAALAAAGFAAVFALLAPAQNDTVRVLASNGMKAVVEALKPQIERSIGHSLAIEWGSAARGSRGCRG